MSRARRGPARSGAPLDWLLNPSPYTNPDTYRRAAATLFSADAYMSRAYRIERDSGEIKRHNLPYEDLVAFRRALHREIARVMGLPVPSEDDLDRYGERAPVRRRLALEERSLRSDADNGFARLAYATFARGDAERRIATAAAVQGVLDRAMRLLAFDTSFFGTLRDRIERADPAGIRAALSTLAPTAQSRDAPPERAERPPPAAPPHPPR